MNSGDAHIVYASDNKFAEILGVSLISLYENSRDMENLNVYILDGGINQDEKKKIESISHKYNRSQINWIAARNVSRLLATKIKTDRGSLTQYARLFVSSYLPQNLNRVLYLDCDVIVNKNIRELWNLDLHDHTIGALKDAFSAQYRANIELRQNDIMFNSGVMLIDLKKWREKRVEDSLLRFIKKKNGRIQQGDQGALNAVLSQDTYCFEPRFNSVTIFHDFDYEEMMIYRKPPKGFYSMEDVQRAMQDPTIIHYTTSFLSKRPWVKGSRHRYADVWMKYKKQSPWKDASPWEDSRPQWKKATVNVLEKMPRRAMVYSTGLMQAYGRPWKNRLQDAIEMNNHKGHLLTAGRKVKGAKDIIIQQVTGSGYIDETELAREPVLRV